MGVFSGRVVVLVVLVFLSFLVDSYAKSGIEKNVLTLYSGSGDCPQSENVRRAMDSVLRSSALSCHLYDEYLDLRRIGYPGYYEDSKKHLLKKYLQKDLALIIAFGHGAFKLAELLREHRFANVPLVFYEVNSAQTEAAKHGGGEVHGFVEPPGLKGTLDIIRDFYPDTKRIFVVDDYTEGGRNMRKAVEQEAATINSSISFIYSPRVGLDRLAEIVENLPTDTVVLMGKYHRNINGEMMAPRTVLKRIASAAKHPVFSLTLEYIRAGALGGVVPDTSKVGLRMGEMAKTVLTGKELSVRDIDLSGLDGPVFNFTAMVKAGLDESDLPEYSKILNMPESFYSRNTQAIWGGVGIFSVQFVLIIVLLSNIKRRMVVQREYGKLLNTLEGTVARRTGQLESVNALLADSEFRYRNLVERSFDGIAVVQQREIVYSNSRLAEIFGGCAADLIGSDFIQFIHEDYRDIVQEYYYARLKGRDDVPSVYNSIFIRKDGREVPVEISADVDVVNDERVDFIYVKDNTENVMMQARLTNALNEMKSIFDNSQVGIMFVKKGLSIAKCNSRMAEILGWSSPEEIEGLAMGQFFVSVKSYDYFKNKYIKALRYGEQIHIEYQLADQDGNPVWCLLSGKAFDENKDSGRKDGLVWIIDDISKRKALEEKLRRLATTDPLTGLLNRRRFMEIGTMEQERHTRYKGGLSLVMLDLDRFKGINDTYGHALGDQVLVEFSRLLIKIFRNVDIISRLGGEEFAVLLPSTDIESAALATERFRNAWRETGIMTENGVIKCTVSCGVARMEKDCPDMDCLIRKADMALYQAKNAGRDRVEVYDEKIGFDLQGNGLFS